MRRSTSLLLSLPVALLLASVRPAAASEIYPEAVKAAVPGLPCVPQCTLCHQQNPGMPPANKPFAMKLKAAAPVGAKDTAALGKALQALQMAAAASDADMDGRDDYAELSTGEDPNSAETGAALCVTIPLYGCGASTIAGSASKRSMDPGATVAAALVVLAGLMFMRRRR
jgi:hypothetical protein